MPRPPIRVIVAILALARALPLAAQSPFINEIHYDNAGTDAGEFVEIAGAATTSLSPYSLVFYNGDTGNSYKTRALSGVIDNENESGFGAIHFSIAGIQNGAPDGLALVQGASVIQFLSYEGTFTASDGPAAGMESQDIETDEPGTSLLGHSLQLTGSGTSYGDFAWSGPQAESPGEINAGQVFTGGVPSIFLQLAPAQFPEGAGPAASQATITLVPAPASTTMVDLSASPAGQVTVPASVSVDPSGTAQFSIGAIADGASDGDALVAITATDGAGYYAPGQASATVFDIDPPAGRGAAVRVACYNLKNGVGTPGSESYQQALAVLLRVDADVISFSEASPAGDFADLRALLTDLGIQTDSTHFATAGDAFSGQVYLSGDFSFGSEQAIALASRWPITSAVQIGRGVAGRTEMTRYPLMVQVDIPGIAEDPVFVGVHLKAGDRDADSFRRALEGLRIRQAISDAGLDGSVNNVFVLGDINEDFQDFLPSGYWTSILPATHVFPDLSMLPAGYEIGADVLPPNAVFLEYTGFPGPAFDPAGIHIVDSRQQDGASRTFNVGGDARLDYILTSSLTSGNAAPETEVYNSLLEFGFEGLPKPGPMPQAPASFVASDHHLVFGDFILEPVPKITLRIDPAAIDEAAPPLTISAVLEVIPPPVEATEVSLLADRERFVLPESVVVPAGAGPVEIPIALRQPERLGADATLRISAYADGLASGHDYLRVTSRQASGVVLISQYTDPPAGTAPRAIEVVNNSGVPIDFADTPLGLSVGFNGGGTTGILSLSSGVLDPGRVLVMGDPTTGNHLVAEGLLAAPADAFASYEEGTGFEEAGQLLFVKQTLAYNGDDALQLHLASTLTDTFGTVGQDPGNQWSGGGVSSADQNIALRGDVATGSTGWTDPSVRFEHVPAAGGLVGFGLPPDLNDPYANWAAAFGLMGIDAAPSEDLEPDGLSNLLEHAFGARPLTGDAHFHPQVILVDVSGEGRLALQFRQVDPVGRLSFGIESSSNLLEWTSIDSLEHAPPVNNGDGTRTVVLRPDSTLPPGVRFLRLRVDLP